MIKNVFLVIALSLFGMTNAQEPTSKLQPSTNDSVAMVEYLKNHGQEPKSYLLDKLANYKLVIYGEVHKRKASWDLLRSVLQSPRFTNKTGTVFLEIGCDNQEKIDLFFAKDKIDNSLLISIFQNIQMQGWDDRGMYEFIVDLWKLNKQLPKSSRVKVILVDVARPWNNLKTKEEFRNFFMNIGDRNQQMANLIEKNIATKRDKRNSLFVVGFGHAFKSKITFGEKSYVSAGAYLKEHLSENNVFTICPHSGILGNTGKLKGMSRNGLFDYAFAKTGNKPMAINLNNSPFGKEHFDLMVELPAECVGNFENYFDGYVFFMPLLEEGPTYILPELFTDSFLIELRRRANICGFDEWQEYGVKIKDITMPDIYAYIRNTSQKKFWWNILIN